MFREELGNCWKAALFSQKIHFLQLSLLKLLKTLLWGSVMDAII